jgi:hypothetical protein
MWTFVKVSRRILPRMRNVWDKSCRQNQITNFMFSNVIRTSCHLWNGVEKYGRSKQATDDSIIRCIRFSCRIAKATDTHSEYTYNTYFFSTATVITRAHLSVHVISSLHCLPFSTFPPWTCGSVWYGSNWSAGMWNVWLIREMVEINVYAVTFVLTKLSRSCC